MTSGRVLAFRFIQKLDNFAIFTVRFVSFFCIQKTLNCFQSHELLNGQLALNFKRFLGYALSLISQAIELCSNEFAITFF